MTEMESLVRQIYNITKGGDTPARRGIVGELINIYIKHYVDSENPNAQTPLYNYIDRRIAEAIERYDKSKEDLPK